MITQETKIIEVNPEGIPDFLKVLPYWINWKPVFVDGKAKKLPTPGATFPLPATACTCGAFCPIKIHTFCPGARQSVITGKSMNGTVPAGASR